MEKLVCKKQNKSVVNFVCDQISWLNFGAVQKLLRKKDIKINGTRIKEDQPINVNDVIEIYVAQKQPNMIEIVYADEFLLVANKPAGLEVAADQGECLIKRLQFQTGKQLFAVHRIDRNTTGLVVFALTEKSKEQLENAFKNHTIKKYYLAIVVGKPTKTQAKLVAYHKKDSQNAVCYISSTPQKGYSKIITNYKLIASTDILSLLEVEIETGKTHQIRAHLAHIGYPILGDEKYGNKQLNKQYKKKHQMLVAYKLNFNNAVSESIVKMLELPNVKQEMRDAL